MKPTIMIVLGGLLFAGTSLAAEPQSTPVGNSVKVGIDAKTGKRRQLTSEESAALDAQAAKMSAKAGKTRAKGGLPTPVTYAESVAGGVSKDGISVYLAPLESMSSLTATVDANGKVSLLENGQPVKQEKEMASE
jgi:hypothetical protein